MKVVELSGGVGGARMARGLAALPEVELTVVVNVGDDQENHGLHVSPDLDTVVYTLAGVEGDHGWGRAGDTFVANDELARFGMDNRFRIGDKDLALNLYRSERLAGGDRLSAITESIAGSFGITSRVLPASDDRLRTEVRVEGGWISFQEYFVHRHHHDEVQELRFAGAHEAEPAPGVLETISRAEVVVIGPSNPPLSIWPILAVPGIREALQAHRQVLAVSPLFAGKPLKGPADRVMASLGLPAGNRGVTQAYRGLIRTLIVDAGDASEVIDGVTVRAFDTRIADPVSAADLARAILAP